MKMITLRTLMLRFNCIETRDKKWIEVNDLSSGQYSVNRTIRSKTSMLRSNVCHFSHAYFAVKGKIIF